jgi:2,3-bisphosphoglycerate-dependent phosphoglycerate mutase
MTQRFLLVRHCESSGQAADAALTERGLQQAQALAEFLAVHPIDRIVSSPYLRARSTIEPFARRTGLPVELCDDLVEHRLSAEPIAEWRSCVARTFEDASFRAPGGDSAAETLARAWTGIRSALVAESRLPVVVAHGQLISLVLQSIDARFGYAEWESLTNPDVHRVESREGGGFAFRRIWR